MDECLTLPEPENIALFIHSKYKSMFKCTSISKKKWYLWENNKWKEIEQGYILYSMLSNEILKEFEGYMLELESESIRKIKKFHKEDIELGNKLDLIKSKISTCKKICRLLKNTTFKNKVMKEASILFYDENFS